MALTNSGKFSHICHTVFRLLSLGVNLLNMSSDWLLLPYGVSSFYLRKSVWIELNFCLVFFKSMKSRLPPLTLDKFCHLTGDRVALPSNECNVDEVKTQQSFCD